MNKHDDSLYDPAARREAVRLIVSGNNPDDYYAHTKTVLRVMNETEGVAQETVNRVVEVVQHLCVVEDFVGLKKLRNHLFDLMRKGNDAQDILKIDENLCNLEEVPVVNTREQAVNR